MTSAQLFLRTETLGTDLLPFPIQLKTSYKRGQEGESNNNRHSLLIPNEILKLKH